MATCTWFRVVLPLLVGLLAGLLIVGPSALDVRNTAWLDEGDPSTHYLGWLFYRQSRWSVPLGTNPTYGLELANSIVFADSNPLLAMTFKTVAGWLPHPFQYFGLWLLACFVLQAWFAWKLISLHSDNVVLLVLATAFFVIAPPMLWRMHPKIGHLNLVAHFLILAALYLSLRPPAARSALQWSTLLAVAALVHAYLLVIVLALWLADLAAACLRRRISAGRGLLELVCLVAWTGVVCWQAGYFTVIRGIAASGGYGEFGVNALALIDPGRAGYGMWSRVLPDLAEDPSHHESFNYLGLGLILLAPVVAWTIAREPTRALLSVRANGMTAFALVLLTLFAVSPNIWVGGHEYSLPPLNEHLERVANMFRASARMFWPAYYALMLTIIVCAIRGLPERGATLALGAALCIQIWDTTPGWTPIRDRMSVHPASTWTASLTHPFWMDAAKHYTKVRGIQPGNTSKCKLVAAYAGSHGLATDCVSLARFDTRAMNQALRAADQAVSDGRYATDSLYIVDDSAFNRARAVVDRRRHLVANIDGLNVIAPDWKICVSCQRVPEFTEQ